MEKTELEKRWETESEEPSSFPPEESVSAGFSQFIAHPLVETEDKQIIPIVMITCGPRIILGGLIAIDEMACELAYPMAYGEVMNPDGKSITSMVRPLMFTLGIQDHVKFKYDSVYFMRNTESNNMDICGQYEDELKRGMAKSAGIVSPTAQEASQILFNR